MSNRQAQSLAETASSHMHALDACAALLGIERVKVSPGNAALRMAVREDMLNGHAICHGGIVFTLADTAFAHACNSHNVTAVAAGASIEFLAPVRAGDLLTAQASETTLRGRNGIYDVTVHNQAGELVALFRGKSRSLGSALVDT